VLVGHLFFAHMLADYVLQTNWLVGRKGQGWDGLGLHGFMVFAMSVLVLPRWFSVMIIPITLMALQHTGQDWVKVYTGKKYKKIHPFYSYTADQICHYLVIFIMQFTVGSRLVPPPSDFESWMMGMGACVIALTRFYEVTWWANWFVLFPYMNRWRLLSYAERLAAFALTLGGLWFLAPLAAAFRLIESVRIGKPVWKQKYGLLEMALGVLFAIVLGLLMRALLPAQMLKF
jgi:hypothetical protein